MKKMNGIEKSINLKAIKWSWFFSILALFEWMVYDFVQTEELSLAFFLFIMQFILYLFVTLLSKSKTGGKNGSQTIWYVICIVLFLLLFGGLLYFFHK